MSTSALILAYIGAFSISVKLMEFISGLDEPRKKAK